MYYPCLSRVKLSVSAHHNTLFQSTGPAKKSRIPDEEVNLLTAYHEAGHTLVAYFTKDAIPIHKVTIIPRGMSLGHVSVLALFSWGFYANYATFGPH
jgi:hypothetical protein